MLPLLVITALINPACHHPRLSPQRESADTGSILYGVYAAFLLITVITWVSCFNAVMTSDKFVYLFGRVIPALSLVLSMSLRFVPRFTAQIKVISNAQECVGRDVSNGGLLSGRSTALKSCRSW